MGSSGPKSVEDGVDKFQELLDWMQERVSEAILSGSSDDYFLGLLLEIVIPSIRDNRHVFPNPLHEPVLYKQMVLMVREALEDLSKVEEGMDRAFKKSIGAIKMGGE
jgi:hypothetical protein